MDTTEQDRLATEGARLLATSPIPRRYCYAQYEPAATPRQCAYLRTLLATSKDAEKVAALRAYLNPLRETGIVYARNVSDAIWVLTH